MKFEVLLLGLSVLLKRAARSPRFRARLRSRQGTVVVRTRGGRSARSFVFCAGEVFSRAGVLTPADVSLIWNDAGVAVAALRDRSGDGAGRALAAGLLTIEGDTEFATWFGDLVHEVRKGASADRAVGFPTVAMIGLGRMGMAIAQNLRQAGFPLVVYNRTQAKAEPLGVEGVRVTGSPAEAAAGAKVVLTSLIDDDAVLTVLSGSDGLLAGLPAGGLHIGTSTVSQATSRRVAQLHRDHGSLYLAAPVVGRPEAARAGGLFALAAGEGEAYDAGAAVLNAFARRVEYLGDDPAVACAAKLAVNYTAASLIELMGEVYAYGEKASIPGAALHQAFCAMWAQPALQFYATRLWRRDFAEVGFDMRGGLKDILLMQDAASAAGVAWEFAEPIRRKMARAIEHGLEGWDWSTTYELTRLDAGLSSQASGMAPEQ